MQQIVKGRPATVGYTFERAGTDVDPSPDSATVTISRNGVVLGDPDQDASNLGLGVFGAEVTPDKLGVLQLDWTATFDGEQQTATSYVEVVGGYYFSVREIRDRYPDVADIDADKIVAARAEAEETIEGLRAKAGTHVAFVQRAEEFIFSGNGRTRLGIPRYKVREVLDCTVDGEPVDLAELKVSQGSVYRRRWPMFSEVALTVAHGENEPPGRIKSAAMLLTKELLINGPIDSRASQVETSAGGVITLALPGRAGYVTGIPEVDAAIDQFGRPAIRHSSVVLGDRGNLFEGA